MSPGAVARDAPHDRVGNAEVAEEQDAIEQAEVAVDRLGGVVDAPGDLVCMC